MGIGAGGGVVVIVLDELMMSDEDEVMVVEGTEKTGTESERDFRAKILTAVNQVSRKDFPAPFSRLALPRLSPLVAGKVDQEP